MKNTQVWVESSKNKIEHDYDITKVDNKVSLIYSDNPLWSSELKGNSRASWVDDGNSVKIKIGDKKFHLDYDELLELTALIIYCNETKIELREYQTTKFL